MDKHILFVKSDIDSTKALKNKDLVSFHKQPRVCFNRTTLEKCGIREGMYARFASVDYTNRVIRLEVEEKRPTLYKREYYKITNPNVDNRNTYCYIRTTNLMFNHDIVLYGAFDFDVHESWRQLHLANSFEFGTMKVINIHF